MENNGSHRPDPFPTRPAEFVPLGKDSFQSTKTKSDSTAPQTPSTHLPFRGRAGRDVGSIPVSNPFKAKEEREARLRTAVPSASSLPDVSPLFPPSTDMLTAPEAPKRVYFDRKVPVQSRMIIAIFMENQAPQPTEIANSGDVTPVASTTLSVEGSGSESPPKQRAPILSERSKLQTEIKCRYFVDFNSKLITASAPSIEGANTASQRLTEWLTNLHTWDKPEYVDPFHLECGQRHLLRYISRTTKTLLRYDLETSKVWICELEPGAALNAKAELDRTCALKKLEKKATLIGYLAESSTSVAFEKIKSDVHETDAAMDQDQYAVYRARCVAASCPPAALIPAAFDNEDIQFLERTLFRKLRFLCTRPWRVRLQIRLGNLEFTRIPIDYAFEERNILQFFDDMRDFRSRSVFDTSVPDPSRDCLAAAGFSLVKQKNLVDYVVNINPSNPMQIRARFCVSSDGQVRLSSAIANRMKHVTCNVWLPQKQHDIRVALETDEIVTDRATLELLDLLRGSISVVNGSVSAAIPQIPDLHIKSCRKKLKYIWSNLEAKLCVSHVNFELEDGIENSAGKASTEVELQMNSWRSTLDSTRFTPQDLPEEFAPLKKVSSTLQESILLLSNAVLGLLGGNI
jgi:hypothetical protein